MELLLILIYVSLCYVVFKVFRIPVNQWSLATAALGGIIGIALLLLIMNYNHPFTTNARIYLKIEHSSPLAALSDEQLALMIADLEQRIAARLSGEEAKITNEGAVTALTALPPPAHEALCDATGRRKRNPKSTPERLAYAREYKRQRKAGNPNAAAAARAAAQGAKRTSGG
jgi:hypothetical protein